MNKRYIIALDQGTTSARAVLFDTVHSCIIGMKSKPFQQIYPTPGWVEHDAVEIWKAQLKVAQDVIREVGVHPEDIACIGITNQRETVVVWDRNTGKPIHHAIVWQCRRTASLCTQLKVEGWGDAIREKTGLVIDAYFSGTKIQWILEHVPGAREKAQAGELLAGTIDTWLIWNLTGGKVHVTDCSNASRTMLYNIEKLQWDEELLHAMHVPKNMLPQVVPSSGVVGETLEQLLGAAIPISGIAGDQQAALFGQACFEVGSAKNTYGTGCFILMNTGRRRVLSQNGLLTTIAWNVGNTVEYALEGSVFNAGSAIQWLRDEMGIIDNAAQADTVAERTGDTGGVYVVPAFTGLGAPYWDMYARGAIIGITRGIRREHIVRATLESIAYQCRDVFEAMQQDADLPLKELKVDGGASVSNFLMQFQADIMNVAVKRPCITETTALGAIYLAGLGVGVWNSREEIQESWALDQMFTPSMEENARSQAYHDWKRAVERSIRWER